MFAVGEGSAGPIAPGSVRAGRRRIAMRVDRWIQLAGAGVKLDRANDISGHASPIDDERCEIVAGVRIAGVAGGGIELSGAAVELEGAGGIGGETLAVYVDYAEIDAAVRDAAVAGL